jgi:hypothetical protein
MRVRLGRPPGGGRLLRPAAGATWLLVALVAVGGCDRPGATDTVLQREVDALLPRLEALSGLPVLEPVRVALRSRDELRAYVAAELDRELPPEEAEAIAAAYRAFGLFPDTLELRALLLDLYTEQVMGYYDPRSKELYLVEGVAAAALRPVLVHELVHALQDQHANLDSLISRHRGNDRQTAAQAAAEGHATLVMFAFLAEEETGQPVDVTALPDLGAQLRPSLEAQNEQFPVFRDAPRVIRETLLFPYLQGAAFVQALWQAAAERPGYAPAERPAPLGSLLPHSTKQVMFPETHFLEDRSLPLELFFQEGDGGAGDGWRTRYENTLGALEIMILLGEHLGRGAEALAAGWAGDRFRLLEGPAGGEAIVWYSVWDDGAAAEAFADAYRRILEARPERSGRAETIAVEGRRLVLVVDAAGAAHERVPVPALARIATGER